MNSSVSGISHSCHNFWQPITWPLKNHYTQETLTCQDQLSFSSPEAALLFGQHQESRPLARSNDIPVLNGFVNTIDWDQDPSDLSDLTLSMRRVMGSPWIADFRCWTRPEVAILGADQKEPGLWGREWTNYMQTRTTLFAQNSCTLFILLTSMYTKRVSHVQIIFLYRNQDYIWNLSLPLHLVRDYGTVYTQIGVSSRKEHLKEKFIKLLLTVLEIEDYYIDAHSLILNLNTRIELN